MERMGSRAVGRMGRQDNLNNFFCRKRRQNLWGRMVLQYSNRGRSERLAANLFFREGLKVISCQGDGCRGRWKVKN